ncbi:TPA: glycosyltransferase family 4 protein [Candidatus Scatousia excrementigallinarum]|uniref:Glycosyltransferase family 4 protein n=1 Tax=Candidatus Scatousia excrementigallinarum TaxID=2840935 RepID=A0A9D1EZ66_9BACT|nr:glycosyltransferase family 4 protein [Candidatus Scatousia excrementigallinarum]
MKILLVNKFHYIKGGSETYYFGLGELLEKSGHDVIYFSMKDDKNKPCPQEKYFVENVDFNAPMGKFKLMKTALKMLYSREAKKKFKKLILDEKPDIIHLNIFQSQLTASIVDVAHKYRIPIVYTAHDLKSVCPNYQMLNHGEVCEKCLHGKYINCFKTSCMKDSRLKSLLATMEADVYKRKKTYRKIDLIITPSEFYKRKIDEAKIADCPVVHMTNFLPQGTQYSAVNKVGDYILYFGRLSREKGIITLIEAYSRSNCELPLYIVGTGAVKEEIEGKIKELSMTDKIKLLGFKSGRELKDIVDASRCVVLPSEWYENGPYSIMEAMAAGKPVIVSNLGGLPEFVDDGITGYIVPAKDAEKFAEAIKKMSDMPSKDLLAMGQAATQKAKSMFDAQKYAREVIEKYKEIIENGR